MGSAPRHDQQTQTPRPAADAPALRLWTPDVEPSTSTPEVAAPALDAGELGPQMTLSEFFERWYLPNVLRRQKKSSADTIELYRKAIDYWKRLTGDPPLAAITEETLCDKFRDGLHSVTYRRGLAGVERRLDEQTIVKHLRMVRAVYFRTGPKVDAKRRSTGLLEEITHLEINSPELGPPKPRFTVAQARHVFAACESLTAYGIGGGGHGRRGDGGPGADDRWRALVAQLYYGGHRIGAMFGARWRMLVEIEGRHFWDLPRECVKGKRRGVVKYVHAHALELLRRLPRRPGDDDELVFPWLTAHAHTHLLDRHYWLQRLAGMRTAIDFHGWRRTHEQEIFRLGLGPAVELARRAAAHGDKRTTIDHYLEVEPLVIDRLEPLDPEWNARPAADDPNQTFLF